MSLQEMSDFSFLAYIPVVAEFWVRVLRIYMDSVYKQLSGEDFRIIVEELGKKIGEKLVMGPLYHLWTFRKNQLNWSCFIDFILEGVLLFYYLYVIACLEMTNVYSGALISGYISWSETWSSHVVLILCVWRQWRVDC